MPEGESFLPFLMPEFMGHVNLSEESHEPPGNMIPPTKGLLRQDDTSSLIHVLGSSVPTKERSTGAIVALHSADSTLRERKAAASFVRGRSLAPFTREGTIAKFPREKTFVGMTHRETTAAIKERATAFLSKLYESSSIVKLRSSSGEIPTIKTESSLRQYSSGAHYYDWTT